MSVSLVGYADALDARSVTAVELGSQLQLNPRKRITKIGPGHDVGAARVVLDVNGQPALYVETSGLSPGQAETLAAGYLAGFKGGCALSPEFIEILLQDPLEMAAFQVPLSIGSDERALFRRGATAALGLVAQGYWVELEELASTPPTAPRQ